MIHALQIEYSHSIPDQKRLVDKVSFGAGLIMSLLIHPPATPDSYHVLKITFPMVFGGLYIRNSYFAEIS